MNEIQFNAYPIFEADQVLTADHLNDFVNYLDEQGRLTRNKLLGIGINCGFEYDFDAFNSTITLHEGVGITSEGFLIIESAGSDPLTCFKPYLHPNEDDPYPPFLRANGSQYDLFELEDTKTDSNLFLTEFDGNLSDYAFLLFVECYDKTLKNCVENDCQEKGTERIFTTRKLLVSKTDAQVIIGTQAEHNRGYRLQHISLRRFKVGNNTYTAYAEIHEVYRNLINQGINRLQTVLPETYTLYGSVLEEEYNGSDPFLLAGMNLQTIRTDYLANHPFAIQYLYDFICDLAEAYSEFRQVAFDYDAMCCPPEDAFPKHLFLGPIPPETSCLPSYYRTGYIHTAKREGQDLIELKLKTLHRKMIQMVLNFQLPSIDSIRITPSRYGDVAFSRSSIPYYYSVSLNSGLVRSWNPELSRRCRWDENLSYFSANYSTKNFVTEPLDFDLSSYDFYRIEGHIGEDYEIALKSILTTRKTENLDFDIVAIKLGTDGSTIDVDDMRCSFQDLQIVYESWARELECVFSGAVSLLSGYDVRETVGIASETTNYQGIRIATGSPINRQGAYGENYNSVGNNVIQNIDSRAGTYGAYVRENTTINGRTANEYYIEVEQELLQIEEIQNLNQTDYTLAVEGPVKTMLTLIEMAELIAEAVEDTDIDRLILVEQSLRQILNSYIAALADYSAADSSLRIDQSRIQNLLWLLDQVCALQQLITILREIEKRKLELQRLNLFAGFVDKHPGINHRGGVPKGGTFIMVYEEESEPIDEEVPVDGFLFRGRVLAPNGAFLPGANVFVAGTTSGTTTDLNGTFQILLNTLPANLIISFPGFVTEQYLVGSADNRRNFRLGFQDDQVQDELVPPNRSVVLDFFLPYQCCSDCPSVTYVFEEPVPELGLDPTTFCVPFTGDNPTFRVVPEDGEIVGEGVVQNDEGAYLFDPNTVNLNGELFTMINFTLNGQAMPLTVRVYAEPVPSFLTDIGDYNPTNNSVPVTINNTSTNAQRYEWDFGDGTPITEINDDTFIHNYQLGDNNTFLITLRAFNGPCEAGTEDGITIEIPVEDPTLVFDFNDICVPSDVGPNDLQLFVTPANAIVTGPGVSGTAGGPWFFDPNAVVMGADADREVVFAVNGVDMPNTVRLYRHPVPALTILVPDFDQTNGETVIVTLQNDSQFFTDANWNYGDGSGSTELAATHTHEYPIGLSSQYIVTLSIFNTIDNCTETITRTVLIPQPTADIRERNDRSQICNGGETIFIEVNPGGGILQVSPTINLLQVDANTWSFIADDQVIPDTYQFNYSPPSGNDVNLFLNVAEAFEVQAQVEVEGSNQMGAFVAFRAFPAAADQYRWFFTFESPTGPPIIRGPFSNNEIIENIPFNTGFVYFTAEVTIGDCVVLFGPNPVRMAVLLEVGVINFPESDNPPIGLPPIGIPPVEGGGIIVNPGGFIEVTEGGLGNFNPASFNSGIETIESSFQDSGFRENDSAMELLTGTKSFMDQITLNLVDPNRFQALRSGETDTQIANTTQELVSQTAAAILNAGRDGQSRNNRIQTALIRVLNTQIGQFINLNTIKEDDFRARTDMGRTFTVINTELRRLKDRGVNINTSGNLVRTIRENGTGAQDRLAARLNTLIEQIEA